MSSATTLTSVNDVNSSVKKKPMSIVNIGVGAALQVFEVSTLGQPFEVLKTHMAANRNDNMIASIKKTYQRGGISGFYQGLIPWAWIEASTKGAVLLFASSELDYLAKGYFAMSPSSAAILSGMGGGLAQAYSTMGFCTFMKTVEVTRHKSIGISGEKPPGTLKVAADVLRKEGIVGLNRGVSAVAVRQMTNWGSRFGFSRIIEGFFKGDDPSKKLTTTEKFLSSALGGALGTWNQPIEVIRVEMQKASKAASGSSADGSPNKKLSIVGAAKNIWNQNGLIGFYRGIVPRIGLSIYLTVCMVFGGDQLKERFKSA